MFAVLIGAADEIGQLGGGMVDDDRDVEADRPNAARPAADCSFDLVIVGEGQW